MALQMLLGEKLGLTISLCTDFLFFPLSIYSLAESKKSDPGDHILRTAQKVKSAVDEA